VPAMAWCGGAGVASIVAVQPLHVATWIEAQFARELGVHSLAAARRDPPPVRLAGDGPSGPVTAKLCILAIWDGEVGLQPVASGLGLDGVG
jgi:hypothetical protein